MLTRRNFLGTLSSTGVGLAAAQSTKARQPNILLILADDMGFSDVGCYGSEIATPHLDGLAGQGVRFTQFYNCARCCPSRASLLTGLYPHQAGIGHMVDKAGPAPGYANDLSPRSRTIAQVLHGAGYQTGMVGKWHVTPVNESKRNWPLQRGFDRYYGIIHGGADYYNPVTLTRGNEPVAPDSPDYFFTDALGKTGAEFVADFARTDKPWFLYAAFTAPHWPLHAREEDIRKYEKRYHMGWDEMREARHQRQLKMGMLAKRWDLTSRDTHVPAWKDAENKDWQVRRMATYSAQVEQLDRNIGRLLAQLRASGQEDNTLVMFMSDNGGCAEEIGPNWKGLHIPAKTRDGRPVRVGNVPGVMPGPEDTYESYGMPWANASNTPFRMYKHWVHEGGIATPLIARWPGRFKASSKFIDTPTHFIDIMATCVEAGAATYPTEGDVIPMQGRSLLPLIQDHATPYDRTLFWEHEGNCCARRGKWKLVRKFPGAWELYDMDVDRTELHDMAVTKPDIVREMSGSWDHWATAAGVLPWAEVNRVQTNR
jgi:arylsulfatase A-like enzyme